MKELQILQLIISCATLLLLIYRIKMKGENHNG